MNFLNSAAAQVTDLFRSLTPGARIIAVLLLAVVVVSGAYLFRFQVEGGEEYLLGNAEFTDGELARMEAALGKAGLQARRAGARLRVVRGQQAAYMAALAEGNALPENFNDLLKEMLAESSVWESRQQREMKQKVYEQRQLALILRNMKGIEFASVQYTDVGKPGLGESKERSVNVSVRTKGNHEVDDEQIRTIRDTVASALGTDRAHVLVTDLFASKSYPYYEPGTPGLDSNAYLAAEREMERYYKNQIEQLLVPYPGAIVQAHVEIDPILDHTTSSTQFSQPQAINTESYSKNVKSNAGTGGARPGFNPNQEAQGNQARSVAQSQGSENSTDETRENVRSVTGHEQTTKRTVGLVPTDVRISISLPESYFPKAFQERWKIDHPADAVSAMPAATRADLQRIQEDTTRKIQDQVKNQLKVLKMGEDEYPRVVVETHLDLPTAPETPPAFADTAGTWLASNWQTLAMVGVGLISLVFLRGMLKAPLPAPEGTARPGAVGIDLSLVQAPEGREEEARRPTDEVAEGDPKLRRRSGGPNLRDDLVTLVKEDPDTAANILRTWIGDAA